MSIDASNRYFLFFSVLFVLNLFWSFIGIFFIGMLIIVLIFERLNNIGKYDNTTCMWYDEHVTQSCSYDNKSCISGRCGNYIPDMKGELK